MINFNNLSNDKTTLLIDGDLYMYQACASLELEVDWGEDIWSLACDVKDVKSMFEARLKQFTERLQTEEYVVCWTEGDNFRKTIYPDYKGGRKKTRKPVGYRAAVDWAKLKFPSVSHTTLEADDVMGIIQSARRAPTCIVSDDKDLKTIPGRLYRPRDDELLHIKDQEADYNFLYQCLVGDTTDGYNGCPKIGPKTAPKILGNHPSWEQVAIAYQKAGLTREQAIQQSRCARILRAVDWNFETQTINLWEPGR